MNKRTSRRAVWYLSVGLCCINLTVKTGPLDLPYDFHKTIIGKFIMANTLMSMYWPLIKNTHLGKVFKTFITKKQSSEKNIITAKQKSCP